MPPPSGEGRWGTASASVPHQREWGHVRSRHRTRLGWLLRRPVASLGHRPPTARLRPPRRCRRAHRLTPRRRLRHRRAHDPAAAPQRRALGIDVSPRAIEIARCKAAESGVDASFQVLDALRLVTLGEAFDTVVDSGLFHVFDDAARAATSRLCTPFSARVATFTQVLQRPPARRLGPAASPRASCAPRSAPGGASVARPDLFTSTGPRPPTAEACSPTSSGWRPRKGISSGSGGPAHLRRTSQRTPPGGILNTMPTGW